MFKIITLGFVLMMALCQKTELTEDFITADATLANALPVDGCDWHFTMNNSSNFIQYVPDAGSKSTVEAIIKNIPAGTFSTSVRLTYKPLGTKQSVQCGWNKKQDIEEINIKTIEVAK